MLKKFDTSTVKNFLNAVENRGYFGIITALCFKSLMSVFPAKMSPEDDYLLPLAKKEQLF